MTTLSDKLILFAGCTLLFVFSLAPGTHPLPTGAADRAEFYLSLQFLQPGLPDSIPASGTSALPAGAALADTGNPQSDSSCLWLFSSPVVL